MADTDIDTELHTVVTKMGIHEVVRRLNKHLGPTLVAALANVRDRKLPHKWARAEKPVVPGDEAQKRLLEAHRLWLMISDDQSDYIARAWFIGANPRLGEETPIMKLREGELPAVMSAAKAFLAGSHY
jgi:hypothetical protein